jgi:hypothetical protein
MPVPTVATYSVDALIAAHTALRNLIDSGSSAGRIDIRGEALELLATVPLSSPAGTINGSTGQFTLSIAAVGSAAYSGTAAYAEVVDGNHAVHLALPAQAGTAAVAGKIVLNSLSIVAGTEVSVASAVIG